MKMLKGRSRNTGWQKPKQFIVLFSFCNSDCNSQTEKWKELLLDTSTVCVLPLKPLLADSSGLSWFSCLAPILECKILFPSLSLTSRNPQPSKS